MEIKTIKNLIDEEVKYNTINKIVKDEFDNQNLIDELTTKFTEKGYPIRTAIAVLNEDQQFNDIPELYQVAFIESAKESLDWEILNVNKWFSDELLLTYDTSVIEITKMDSLKFKNVIKIDDFNYLTYWDLKDIYEGYNNGLFFYNYDTQREPEYISLGTKKHVIKKYSLNMKAVDEIARDIISGDYEEDMITFNVLLKNQKIIPQVSVEETKLEGIVNVEVVPDHNRNSKNYTVVNPLDGWHRTKAGVRAYGEALRQGVKLKRGFPLKLVMRDMKGAQHIVGQIFKINSTNRQWTHGLENSDYNEFISVLVDSSKVLKGNVVSTYEEYMAITSLTYSYILSIAVEKFTDIPVNSKLQRKMIAENMANTIDMIFDYLLLEYKDMKTLIKETHLVEPNIFIGYLAIAEELRDVEGNLEDYIVKIGERLCTLPEEQLKELKLTFKVFNTIEVYKYFKNLAKEVIIIEE